MKSDREMIESILQKAHEKEEKMRKTKKSAALSLALIAVICAAVGVGDMTRKTPSAKKPDAAVPSVTQATKPENLHTAGGVALFVASAAEVQPGDALTKVEHRSGVQLPISGQLVIENVSGMSGEEKSMYHSRLNDRLSESWQLSKTAYHIGGAESENYIASLAFQGKFIVFADDIDALEKIEMNCGAYGRLVVMPATWNGKMPAMGREWFAAIKEGQSLAVSAQEYTNVYLNNNVDENSGKTEPIGMFVNYDISEAFLNEKELHPAMGYERFSDEISIRAVYRDGSEESYTVLLTFDENGALSAAVK